MGLFGRKKRLSERQFEKSEDRSKRIHRQRRREIRELESEFRSFGRSGSSGGRSSSDNKKHCKPKYVIVKGRAYRVGGQSCNIKKPDIKPRALRDPIGEFYRI